MTLDALEESYQVAESVDEEITVVAQEGKDGQLPISRLVNGKIVLFAKYDPLSYKIKPGDIVDCVIIKVKPTYVIVKPLKIRRN